MYKIDDSGAFYIVRGDSADFDIYLPILDDKGEIIGEYTLQEGDTLLFTVKKNTRTTDILIQKSGQHISLEPTDTKDLSYGNYVYDAELTYASGFVDTVILPSPFVITEEVTF